MSARILAIAALATGLSFGVGCGTCMGSSPPTCDPVDAPDWGRTYLGASCAEGFCAEQAILLIEGTETTLRYLDEDGNIWLVTWER